MTLRHIQILREETMLHWKQLVLAGIGVCGKNTTIKSTPGSSKAPDTAVPLMVNHFQSEWVMVMDQGIPTQRFSGYGLTSIIHTLVTYI